MWKIYVKNFCEKFLTEVYDRRNFSLYEKFMWEISVRSFSQEFLWEISHRKFFEKFFTQVSHSISEKLLRNFRKKFLWEVSQIELFEKLLCAISVRNFCVKFLFLWEISVRSFGENHRNFSHQIMWEISVKSFS